MSEDKLGTVFYEAKLSEVIKHYATGCDIDGGNEVISYSYCVDPIKDVVVFKFYYEKKEKE
jgi:hypothetical protein